jgi:hypothetical protein
MDQFFCSSPEVTVLIRGQMTSAAGDHEELMRERP